MQTMGVCPQIGGFVSILGPLNSWPRLTLGLAYMCADYSISWSLNPGPWLSAVGHVACLIEERMVDALD